MHLLREICLKCSWNTMLSLLSFWLKETEGTMESSWKKYLIPQMVPSIWESIFGLLSIVSLAWPEHIKPHLKSNFVSKHLWKRNSEIPKGEGAQNRLIKPIRRCLKHCYTLRMWLWWVRMAKNATWTNLPLEFSLFKILY